MGKPPSTIELSPQASLLSLILIVVAVSSSQADEQLLIDLARKRFPDLSASAAQFFEDVAADRPFDVSAEDADANDPSKGAEWPSSRAISIEHIAWCCTAPEAREFVAAHGIRIVGARIEGDSDSTGLASIDVPFGVSLVACHLPRGLNVGNSSFRQLVLNRSHLAAALDADGLAVAKSLRAVGLMVDGDANLRRLRAGDGVDLSSAVVRGTVHLPAADIDGDLRLTGATVAPPPADDGNPAALAINLDLSHVSGTAYLDSDEKPFSARGAVRLVLTQIGGNLDCWGGQFDCGSADDSADAIYANGLQIDGSVFLAHGMTARGTISFRTARIQHYLNLYELASGGGPALGNATLDLQACHAGTVNCDTFNWTRPGRLVLNGFVYDRVEFVKQTGDVETQLPLGDADFLTWLNLQAPLPFFPQTYEHLASVLRQEGYDDEARDVLIQKERELGARSGRSVRDFVWYRLFGPVIAFGHNPLLGLRWLVGVWLVAAAVFAVASRRGLLVHPSTLEEPIAARPPEKIGAEPPLRLQPLMYALDVLVPLVDFGQAARWVPDRRRRSGAALQWFHWGLIVIGWTLTTLVVAGMTGLVRD